MNRPHARTQDLLRVFWKYCRIDRRNYYASFALMAFTLVFDLARPFILKDALDEIGLGNIDQLQYLATIFMVMVFLEYLTRSGFNYLLSIAYLKTINRIRESVFHHVLRLRLAVFDHEPIGRLMTRTINDAESLGETLRAGIATIVVDILTILGVLFVMLRMELKLAPVMAITVPVVVFTVRYCGKKLRAKYLDIRIALAKANGVMAEGINGIEVVQLFHQQEVTANQFETINREYRQSTIWSNVYDASLYAIIDAVSALSVALILFWAHGEILGPIELSVVIVYINLVDRIYVPIRDLSSKFTVIQQALAALQRIFELLDTDERVAQGKVMERSSEARALFDQVSFRYADDAPQVLNNVSFEVKPGKVLALVGKTGSGKSTIGKLLTRAYDGYEGRILLGNHELSELSHHAIRSSVAVVHQDFEIFPGTIRDNIRMFNPEITDARIKQAVELVKATHMLEQLEGGLDYLLKGDGGNLSIGQLQLIVFARALAHDTPILLMDEATASVDSLTEAWIQEALQEIFKHKTVIVVAHRLSTIKSADEILVLSEGSVIQRGTHEELSAEPGAYADLVTASQAMHTDDMERQIL